MLLLLRVYRSHISRCYTLQVLTQTQVCFQVTINLLHQNSQTILLIMFWSDSPHQDTHTHSHVSVVRQCLPPVCLGREVKAPLHNWSAPSLTPLMAAQILEEMILSVWKNRRGLVEHPPGLRHRKKGCLYTVGNGGVSQVLCVPAKYGCINGPVKWVIPYSRLFSITQRIWLTQPCWHYNSPAKLFKAGNENLDWRCW